MIGNRTTLLASPLILGLCLAQVSTRTPGDQQPPPPDNALIEFATKRALDIAGRTAVERLVQSIPPEGWQIAELCGALGGALEIHVNPRLIPKYQRDGFLEKGMLLVQLRKELDSFQIEFGQDKSVYASLSAVGLNVKGDFPKPSEPISASFVSAHRSERGEPILRDPSHKVGLDSQTPGVLLFLSFERDKSKPSFVARAEFIFVLLGKSHWQVETRHLEFQYESSKSEWKIVKR